jgi:hypothetical protein
MYIFYHFSLISSQNEKCFAQNFYRKSKHIFYVQFFFKSSQLRDNVETYCRTGQATDDIMRRMRTACWITKATNTQSEYVILIAFQGQQWMHERPLIQRLYVRYLLQSSCFEKRK